VIYWTLRATGFRQLETNLAPSKTDAAVSRGYLEPKMACARRVLGITPMSMLVLQAVG